MTTHQTVLSIDGMTCGHCTKAVEKALAALPGVRSVAVQLTPGRATIVHDGADLAAITRLITDEGYEVTQVDDN
jgi:copper chaperone